MRKFSLGVIVNKFLNKVYVWYVLMCFKFFIMKNMLILLIVFVCWYIFLNNYYF